MVLTARPRPALIVPDELSWTVWGADPAARGLAPASAPEQARALLAPEVVPAPLAGALAAELARVPARPLVVAARGPAAAGPRLAELLRDGYEDADGKGDGGDAEGREGGDADGGHDEEDGHDMMAIVGEPSADGLVMEPLELELGPLSPVLPGGLLASMRLDGDLVASCELRSTLVARSERGEVAVDPLAPIAWAVAAAVATERAAGKPASPTVGWSRVAAVELERAVSHLAWLRSLGRLLGWAELVARAQRTLEPVLGARRGARLEGAAQVRALDAEERTPDSEARGLATAAKRAAKLADLLEGRRLAARARGRGSLGGAASLVGPNGRAAGSRRDARGADSLYRELGFEAVVREAGDAEARVLVRAHEAVAAVALAAAALARAADPGDRRGGGGFASPAGAAVEGPRGPVLASAPAPGTRPLLAAPGADAAAAGAAAGAEGQEWSAALLTLVSFDLSPWRVPG